MIGEGELKGQVKSYIKKYHLNVDLLPATTPVQPYYQKSKSFVLTSLHEGFPLTILESFYYYCPAICPSLEEIKPFFKYESSKFIYIDQKTAVKLICQAISNPLSLRKTVKKYHDQITQTRDQNFHDTINYLQQFL